MKILIVVAHPAHVHYFKNFVQQFQKKGHDVLFFARNRECIIDLIKTYNFNYLCYGEGGKNIVSKITLLPAIDYMLYKASLNFKTDFFISFGSISAAHIAKLTNKPYIAFEDTEHSKIFNFLYMPLSDVIFSPYVWSGKLHKKQILIKTFMEFFYLSDRYFLPNKEVLKQLNVNEDCRYCVVRFIAWNASHDVGYKGLSFQEKIKIVKSIAMHFHVFISSEGTLPQELEQYRLNTHPSQFHSVLKYASLCVSEGSTTASEAVVLGTPTIYVNPLKVAYCNEEEKYGLLYQDLSVDEIINKSIEILSLSNVKEIYEEKRHKLHSEMIDGTAFLDWFIEYYPNSKKIMQENPDYQFRFK